eukprot:TRINITY_DN5918_c0_g1_i1.p1 TRINITY_DN5918_c0_g1~~TRINITY_DN5918_c0_g1_i1.p1  ORF type:complete len:436 (-),score=80.69 TRINITY_DN5918_c0_g1_i1:62-1369(-)
MQQRGRGRVRSSRQFVDPAQLHFPGYEYTSEYYARSMHAGGGPRSQRNHADAYGYPGQPQHQQQLGAWGNGEQPYFQQAARYDNSEFAWQQPGHWQGMYMVPGAENFLQAPWSNDLAADAGVQAVPPTARTAGAQAPSGGGGSAELRELRAAARSRETSLPRSINSDDRFALDMTGYAAELPKEMEHFRYQNAARADASAGSAAAAGGEGGEDEEAQSNQIFIRNTFLTASTANRSPSLEPFFKERMVKSVPSSRPVSCRRGRGRAGTQLDAPNWSDGSNDQECAYESGAAARAACARLSACVEDTRQRTACSSSTASSSGGKLPSANGVGAVPFRIIGDGDALLKRTEAVRILENADTATMEVPSKGSLLHELGMCKPCAFVLKAGEGCKNGLECQFCHLCEPGEKKRRKKERLQLRQTHRRQRMEPVRYPRQR